MTAGIKLVACLACGTAVATFVRRARIRRRHAKDDRQLLDQATRKIRAQWVRQQSELKKQLVETDSAPCLEDNDGAQFPNLKYVGGVDISFFKQDPTKAVACVTVLSFPDLEVLVARFKVVSMTQPYIAGFLAFRECDCLADLFATVRAEHPDLVPQILLVDGNGKLHHRGFGLACQLGVVCNVPTIGIGKKILLVDGMDKVEEKEKFAKARKVHLNGLDRKADRGPLIVPVVGQSGIVWGNALAFNRTVTKPVYVSIGHRVSLDTATRLSAACCRYRLPEPVRQADQLSRQYVRDHFKE